MIRQDHPQAWQSRTSNDHFNGKARKKKRVESWLKVLKNDSKAILTAASLASKATDYLRAFSEPKEETEAA